MPRYEFNTEEEFEIWSDEHLSYEKYEVVFTNHGEVVAVPRKSTQPLIYGYINLRTREAARQFVKKLNEKYSFQVFPLRKFIWTSDREPQDE